MLTWIFPGINKIFPTLMNSLGGWVFVVDVTRGYRRKHCLGWAHIHTLVYWLTGKGEGGKGEG